MNEFIILKIKRKSENDRKYSWALKVEKWYRFRYDEIQVCFENEQNYCEYFEERKERNKNVQKSFFFSSLGRRSVKLTKAEHNIFITKLHHNFFSKISNRISVI